jgi:DNA mismatch endonuclease (patch repair protein)
MASIKGKGNKTTELKLRMGLVRAGLRGFRLHAAHLPGKPDFFFENAKLAIFVDGCFWHGCPMCGHVPKTRSKFWAAKLLRNRERDERNAGKLGQLGIRVLRYWEHDLKNQSALKSTVLGISRGLKIRRRKQ